ncbi:uncharacterized protein [Antedon mediterranea]|uniref:uncharacterized protein n=1 Tax=Antedon mediterranea TaxID=105859 RepID=UPI003AF95265
MAISYIKSLILVLLFTAQSIEFENLGCFYDYAESRTLPGLTSCDVPEPEELCNNCTRTHNYCENRQLMTVDLCLDLCLRRGFLYSGLEARQQCFCGHYFNSTHPPNGKPKSQDECNGPCRGNPSQFCGAELRMMIYRNGQFTNCSGGIYLMNGVVRPSQLMYAPATTITFSCNPGFYQAGPTDSYCWYSGVFSHVRKQTQPSCTRQCEDIQTNIHNITLLSPSRYPDAYVFGDSLLYTCTEGYEPTQDDDSIWQIECTADGTWSTEFQSCSGVSCGYPTVPANGILLGTKFNYPNNISYECNTTGYVLEGNPTRHCQSDKTWSGQVPLCVEEATLSWITIVGIGVLIAAIILIVAIVIFCFCVYERTRNPRGMRRDGQQQQQPAHVNPGMVLGIADQQQPANPEMEFFLQLDPRLHYENDSDPDVDLNIPQGMTLTSKNLNFGQPLTRGKLNYNVEITLHGKKQKAIAYLIFGNYSKEDREAMKRNLNIALELPPHPGVIQPIAEIDDGVKDRKIFGICTEYTEGNLWNYLSSDMPKPTEKDLINYAVQTGEAMDFLHEQGKVCPMLCCRSIMLVRNKKVKINVIGLKNINDQNTDIYKLEGPTKRKVRWMSPEAIKHNIATKKSDVWAFGIVLYEIVTLGDNPYRDKNDEEVKTFISNGNHPAKPLNCSDTWYAIMKKCWRKQPGNRPSFNELVEDLKRLNHNRNVVPPQHIVLKSTQIESFTRFEEGKFNNTYTVVIGENEGNLAQKALGRLIYDRYSKEAREAIEREIKAMFQLPTHPGVIRPIAEINDAGQHIKMIGVCTETSTKGNLLSYLCSFEDATSDVKPKSKELINYFLQIANAMQFLHINERVCPMLCCQLIMLFSDNIVKIPVLGLKYINNENADLYRIGEDRSLQLRWMSPEAIKYSIATKESDVWTFGIVLYEIVTFGDAPYAEIKDEDIRTHVSDGNRIPKPRSCSDTLYVLMKKCWKETPSERPSFDELVGDLENMKRTNANCFK